MPSPCPVFLAGCAAYSLGLTLDDNPYSVGQPEYEQWRSGWLVEHEDTLNHS